MAIALYDVTVPVFQQTLGALEKVLERGLAYAGEHGIDPQSLVETRLFPDMMPLRFQVVSVAQHSWGALDAAKNGVFVPPSAKKEYDYAGLRALVAQTRAALSELTPEAVNACEGNDVSFHLGERKLPFTALGFLLSFSLPNFYFHATTAYDILHMKGVPLGKRDFLGRLQLKG
jgi:uncharacterized protein